MSIYLGNLDIADIERKSGVEFPQALIDYMAGKKQENATQIAIGKWHCFDIPFVLVCGDMGVAQNIYEHLKPLSGDFKEQLQISLSN